MHVSLLYIFFIKRHAFFGGASVRCCCQSAVIAECAEPVRDAGVVRIPGHLIWVCDGSSTIRRRQARQRGWRHPEVQTRNSRDACTCARPVYIHHNMGGKTKMLRSLAWRMCGCEWVGVWVCVLCSPIPLYTGCNVSNIFVCAPGASSGAYAQQIRRVKSLYLRPAL